MPEPEYTFLPFGPDKWNTSDQGTRFIHPEHGEAVRFDLPPNDGRSESRLKINGSTRCVTPGRDWWFTWTALFESADSERMWFVFFQQKSRDDDEVRRTPTCAMDLEEGRWGRPTLVNRGATSTELELFTKAEWLAIQGRPVQFRVGERFSKGDDGFVRVAWKLLGEREWRREAVVRGVTQRSTASSTEGYTLTVGGYRGDLADHDAHVVLLRPDLAPRLWRSLEDADVASGVGVGEEPPPPPSGEDPCAGVKVELAAERTAHESTRIQLATAVAQRDEADIERDDALARIEQIRTFLNG